MKDVMAEFLEKFKIYYYQTGQFMDFTGYDNVLFYKENNIWKYKIGNVIKGETREKVKSMIQEIRVNPAAAKEDWTNIFFAPSWIRALNATGELLKLGRIIEDITLSKEDSENLSKIHQMLPLNYRAILHAQEQDFEKALAFFQEYQATEKQHDTKTREILGTMYWRHLKNQEKNRPQKEIRAYLNLLIDIKNAFSEFRKDEVNLAIEGLKSHLNNTEI